MKEYEEDSMMEDSYDSSSDEDDIQSCKKKLKKLEAKVDMIMEEIGMSEDEEEYDDEGEEGLGRKGSKNVHSMLMLKLGEGKKKTNGKETY